MVEDSFRRMAESSTPPAADARAGLPVDAPALVRAIHQYENNTGQPPPDLADLVPAQNDFPGGSDHERFALILDVGHEIVWTRV